MDRLAEVAEVIQAQQRERALPHLLSGDKIMAILGIKPSPLVGKIKQHLRDLQLSGKLKSPEEAEKYLRENAQNLRALD